MGLSRYRYLLAVSMVGVAVSIIPLLRPDRINDDENTRFRLENREYVLESAVRFAFQPELPMYLSFGDGWMSLDAGCSSVSGYYKIVNGELTLPGGYGYGGWMWNPSPCKGELAVRVRMLNIFFRYPPSIEVDGDRVTIARGPVRLTFLDRKVANIGVPINGRVWRLNSIRTSTWGTRDLGENPPTIALFDGKIEVRTGCRIGKGNFEVTYNQVTFRNIVYDPQPLGAPLRTCVELQQILRDGTVSYGVDGKTLTMARDTMTFTAETE